MTELEERQAEIEQEAVALGATRYRNERPLPWQNEAGKKEEVDLAPAKLLMRDRIEPLAEAIEQFVEEASSGKAGRRHTALPYLAKVDALQAAYLTVRHAINGAAAGKTFASISLAVGDALREHLEMLAMQKSHPGLFVKLTRQLAKSTSAKHRLGVLRHVREKYALAELSWSQQDKMTVGAKLVELAMEATGLFALEQRSTGNTAYSDGGRRRATARPQHLTFTPETAEWLEKAHGRAELLSPIHLPMVAPPRPWRTPYSGGYLTDAIRPKLVRTRSRGYLDELGGVDLSELMRAVNAVQATPWRVNKKVVDAIEAEMALGGGVAGLPRENGYPMPPLPPGIPKDLPMKSMSAMQREAMTVWKGEAARVHAKNEKNEQEKVILSQKLYVAYRFLDERAIYFPHYLDFRGRIYPMAAYLNPQADDVGRSMLEFADGMALGEDGAFWLAVHIAGLFGVDKVSFDDRVQWVHENEEAILQSALDPHGEGRFWTTADKPFQALAACFDWMGYKLNGDAHVSHLPIAMDGSCSGLQHYSALLRDEVGGSAVNLVPGDKPSDVYTMVADRAQGLSNGSLRGTNDYMAQAWQGKVCRKVAKQPTMTLCYSATRYGMRGQIENALAKLDEDAPNGSYLGAHVDNYRAARYMADVIWDALGGVVVAARTAMDWLQTVATIAAEADVPLRWTSPIGLPVLQAYREAKTERINVFVGGKRVRFDLKAEGSTLSRRRQASGIAPNFVHSLDASHLLSTVNLATENGIHHFAMIHDSFGTHAAKTSLLNAVLRESFVAQYSQPVLETFRDEIVAQLQLVKPELVDRIPPLPKTGNLDLEAVKRSDFFFA